jgi:SnoaL-like domain
MTEPDAITAVAAVQNAYASAIDRRDWAALRHCFSADARIKYGRPLRFGDLEEFLAWAPLFHDALGDTLHQVSTHTATVNDRTATASCYLHAVLMEADRSGAVEIFGRYQDELVVADDRWVIRRREFHPVWRRRTRIPDPVPV